MATKQSLYLQHHLPDNFGLIYNSLINLTKFGQLHPNIKKVTLLEDRSPKFIEYNIIEQINLYGLIKSRPMYNARVTELEKGKTIQHVSRVNKNNLYTITFTFSQNKNGTLIVNENIELISNRISGLIFLDKLKKAHLETFQNLRAKLETSMEE